jgi:hypothetical protein
MNKIILNNKSPLSLYKAINKPDIGSATVLTADIWDYVLMYLRRNKKYGERSIYFWKQARNFHNAYTTLPDSSKALLGYYTILNATKTLLSFKKINYTERHGLSNYKKGSKSCLANEKIVLKQSGVLFALSKYLGYPNNKPKETISLKDIFHNLVFCSRAFNFTYKSGADELFLPIENIEFKQNIKTKKARLYFTINKKSYSAVNIKSLGNQFEYIDKDSCKESLEAFNKGDFLIRSKKDFDYDKKLTKFIDFHKKMRETIFYISSSQKLWYIKKINNKHSINKPSLVLIFAALHELSEMERYHPDVLSRYLETNENWLITEFLQNSVMQFIDEISSEITGQNIYPPGFRS